MLPFGMGTWSGSKVYQADRMLRTAGTSATNEHTHGQGPSAATKVLKELPKRSSDMAMAIGSENIVNVNLLVEARHKNQKSMFFEMDYFDQDAAGFLEQHWGKGGSTVMLEEEAIKEMTFPVVVTLRDLFHSGFVSHGDLKLTNFLIEQREDGTVPVMKLIGARTAAAAAAGEIAAAWLDADPPKKDPD
ncbi:unnamed protein product [Vitrella brassicaformis CCMP3155]|uniref:Protein kinase domain-containing protein n=1 Tax=Vitrella brassicaformis (strain CCMP3155) TaxID=1169540 RepID=A0A0G4GXQ6_VITBC|nr:unnamed protein product [Vitrella brassicaformis CCMP3155]|eukprot:CEM35909.1 unnamed protein product [Vitrella brassicaformis CCMP3155]